MLSGREFRTLRSWQRQGCSHSHVNYCEGSCYCMGASPHSQTSQYNGSLSWRAALYTQGLGRGDESEADQDKNGGRRSTSMRSTLLDQTRTSECASTTRSAGRELSPLIAKIRRSKPQTVVPSQNEKAKQTAGRAGPGTLESGK